MLNGSKGIRCISVRLVDFDNILIIFCCFNAKLVPVHTKKSYHNLKSSFKQAEMFRQ